MYNNTSEQFNALITAPGRTFRARLLVGDENLEGISSIKITNGSNNGDALTLGSTISQMVTITMENPGISLSGKEFALQIGLKLDEENIEYIPMGVFIVDKVEVKADKLSITAYDRMMKLSSGYISDLSDETDTVSVLNEMAQKSGVPVSVEGLTAIQMAKPVGYTYREVLMYVSQLHGGFANVNREGTIEIHFWEDSGYVLDPDMGINGFAAGDSYTVNKLTCATGQDEEGNATSISAGTGSGIGISNPFMTQEILDAIYSAIKGFTYDAVTCPVILGDPRLDPWDLLTIQSAAGTEHKVPAMSLEYAYDGGLNMTITSTMSSESEESFDYKGPMQRFEERMVSKIAIVESLTAKKVSAEELEAINARIENLTTNMVTTEYLKANYVDIGMANINKAWIETLLVKGDFLVDTIHGVNGNFSKDLTGVNISGDMIVANTLKADSLILQGDDGIYRRLNIDALGELKVDSNPIYNEKIDGSVLVAQSVTATQIDVTDLFAQNITATNLHITDKSTLGGWSIEGTNIVSDNGGDSETEKGYGRAILTDGRVEFSSNYTKTSDGSSYGVKSAWWLDGKGLGGSEYRESVGETRTALFELEGITLEQYESATTLWASYKVDGLEFVDSLMGEIQEKTTISKSGIELYRADGVTYGGNLSIGINGFTYTNDGDNTLNFKGATNYLFDSTLRTTKGFTFGTNAYTTEYGIGTVWKDGKNHNVVSRYSDGLLVSFGWVGSSNYATISRIRGRTVQYQNSSGTTALSDERLKEDFRTLENWEKFFDALEPCAFKLKTGTSGRYHIGFKAQQVEEALLGSGLTTGDFAGLVKMQYAPDADDEEGNAVYKSAGIEVGDELYGVIYTELIGLAIGEIQKLKKRVKNLEEKL